MSSPYNSNWIFDCGLLDDIGVSGGELPSLDPPEVLWSPSTSNPPLRYPCMRHYYAFKVCSLLLVNFMQMHLLALEFSYFIVSYFQQQCLMSMYGTVFVLIFRCFLLLIMFGKVKSHYWTSTRKLDCFTAIFS